ncbi:GNAT family N-acetyltransferase [Amnibacterium sp. CER49]|uniref:GNAT family N-acetyltransferase n=1 Tax=Amnibacterium sp. CER49 TaxID=3039161 RepID=UPI0024478892|nr:GNAT family N-acetyltransferase [Amnibacterium sp. CER49]MDH2445268.1 GNAT family N-acetyltransferase [Amnibacterium sp. CER49]
MRVEPDDPRRPDVVALLVDHLADMHRESPPESVHALDVEALAAPGITFWSVRDDDGLLLGCGALKALGADEGEVKSMRTSGAARGRGVASRVLAVILDEAARRGYRRVSLETGPQDFFAPARRLYERHGFVACGPFADYREDPYSVFLTLAL